MKQTVLVAILPRFLKSSNKSLGLLTRLRIVFALHGVFAIQHLTQLPKPPFCKFRQIDSLKERDEPLIAVRGLAKPLFPESAAVTCASSTQKLARAIDTGKMPWIARSDRPKHKVEVGKYRFLEILAQVHRLQSRFYW